MVIYKAEQLNVNFRVISPYQPYAWLALIYITDIIYCSLTCLVFYAMLTYISPLQSTIKYAKVCLFLSSLMAITNARTPVQNEYRGTGNPGTDF